MVLKNVNTSIIKGEREVQVPDRGLELQIERTACEARLRVDHLTFIPDTTVPFFTIPSTNFGLEMSIRPDIAPSVIRLGDNRYPAR